MGMTLSLWVFPHEGSVGFCGFLWVLVGFPVGLLLVSAGICRDSV